MRGTRISQEQWDNALSRLKAAHPFLGERETTIAYRFEPTAHGALVTVRDEGFIGRSEAAFGNAENLGESLGWLDAYLSAGAA